MTLILLTKSLPWLVEHWRPWLGRLYTPRHYNRLEDTAASGMPWAADNDAYSGFDEAAFLTMLEAIAGLPGCRFVCAPDVVADADATLELYAEWRDLIRVDSELPAALVLQDGMTVDRVPWGDVDGVFVGGSTEWKLGADAAAIVREANRRGVWSHVGRVNSARRLRWCRAIGARSVDGSGAARFPDKTLRIMSAELAGAAQLGLELPPDVLPG